VIVRFRCAGGSPSDIKSYAKHVAQAVDRFPVTASTHLADVVQLPLDGGPLFQTREGQERPIRFALLDGEEESALILFERTGDPLEQLRPGGLKVYQFDGLENGVRYEYPATGIFVSDPIFLNWWRRRESNPRPRALRPEVYMLIHVYCFNRLLPDGQGKQSAIPQEI
jgi:hypothetical protein